jgi:hypothetical protein
VGRVSNGIIEVDGYQGWREGEEGFLLEMDFAREIYMEISSGTWRIIGVTKFARKRKTTYGLYFKISIGFQCMRAMPRTNRFERASKESKQISLGSWSWAYGGISFLLKTGYGNELAAGLSPLKSLPRTIGMRTTLTQYNGEEPLCGA